MFIGLRIVWEPRSVIAYVNRGNNSLYFSKFKPRTLKVAPYSINSIYI